MIGEDNYSRYYFEDDGEISECNPDKLHFPEGPRPVKDRSLFSKMNEYLNNLDNNHKESLSRLNDLDKYCKSRNVKILTKAGEMGAVLGVDGTLCDTRVKFIRDTVDTLDHRYRLESARGETKIEKAGSILEELKKRHPNMYRYYSRALDSKMDKFADMDRMYSLDVTRVIHNNTAHNIPSK